MHRSGRLQQYVHLCCVQCTHAANCHSMDLLHLPNDFPLSPVEGEEHVLVILGDDTPRANHKLRNWDMSSIFVVTIEPLSEVASLALSSVWPAAIEHRCVHGVFEIRSGQLTMPGAGSGARMAAAFRAVCKAQRNHRSLLYCAVMWPVDSLPARNCSARAPIQSSCGRESMC
eukprot:5912297-Pleurochrysis_carterae.AAC.2